MASFIVHIGDAKCGSTAIQRALYRSREALRDHGIVYETTSPDNGHFALATLLGQSTRGNVAAQQEAARASIARIQTMTRPSDVILISAESLFALKPATIFGALKMISHKIDEIHIIAYLRPPASMYLSLVQQVLKGNAHFTKPDDYQRRKDAQLSAWQRNRRRSSVTVRQFDRARLVGGDVVQDFATILNRVMGIQGLALQGGDENKSISAEQLVVLQDLRRRFLSDKDGTLHPLSGRLIDYFQSLNSLNTVGKPLKLSDDAYRVVCEGNQQIAQNLNDMFSDLQLPVPTFVGPGTTQHAWTNTEDVASILAEYDLRVVDQLRWLVPAFHRHADPASAAPRRADAVAALSAQFAIDPALFLAATQSYWQKEGRQGAFMTA